MNQSESETIEMLVVCQLSSATCCLLLGLARTTLRHPDKIQIWPIDCSIDKTNVTFPASYCHPSCILINSSFHFSPGYPRLNTSPSLFMIVKHVPVSVGLREMNIANLGCAPPRQCLSIHISSRQSMVQIRASSIVTRGYLSIARNNHVS